MGGPNWSLEGLPPPRPKASIHGAWLPSSTRSFVFLAPAPRSPRASPHQLLRQSGRLFSIRDFAVQEGRSNSQQDPTHCGPLKASFREVVSAEGYPAEPVFRRPALDPPPHGWLCHSMKRQQLFLGDPEKRRIDRTATARPTELPENSVPHTRKTKNPLRGFPTNIKPRQGTAPKSGRNRREPNRQPGNPRTMARAPPHRIGHAPPQPSKSCHADPGQLQSRLQRSENMPLGQPPKRRRRVKAKRRIRKTLLNFAPQSIAADRTEHAIPECVAQCRSRRAGQRKSQSCAQPSRPENARRIVVKALSMENTKALRGQILQTPNLVNYGKSFLAAVE